MEKEKLYNLTNHPNGFQSEDEVIAHFGYNPWSPMELKEDSKVKNPITHLVKVWLRKILIIIRKTIILIKKWKKKNS